MRLSFASAADGAVSAAGPDARPLARLRILIVDDDPILLRSLRDVLEGDGHHIEAASEGAAALALFDAASARRAGFDAVITDLGMPGMDGRRVAASIKQRAAETPVILLTGWGERLRAEEELPVHIDCILSKPPRLREVRAALAQHCVGAFPQAASGR